jgi:ankyrin repeat protein
MRTETARIRCIVRVVLAAGFAMLVSISQSFGQTESEQRNLELSLQLVAMVQAEINGAPVLGAAIAFGRGKNSVDLVTANHVVRRGGTAARDIKLRFRDAPNRPLTARLTEHFDPTADIAVLRVNLPAGSPINSCSWDFTRLAPTSNRSRGDRVYAVGNPNGVGWGMPVAPDLVAEADKEKIVFQSNFVASGHSGGALLSEDGALLGMIQADQPPYGSARTIETIVQQLLQWGYLVELFRPWRAHNNDYFSLLEFAAGEGLPKLVGAILEACPSAVNNYHGYQGLTALHFAASENRSDILRKLIPSGGLPNGSYKQQALPPLSEAAFHGHVDAMRVLISAGASLELAGWHGERPLHWAAEGGHTDAVNLLLEAGAAVNGTNKYGRTPLYNAAYKDRLEATRLLLSHGAKTAVRDKDDLSPLDIAIEWNHPAIVKVLIAAGADVNARNRSGSSTPLHDAVYRSQVEIVRMLLEGGAQVNAVNSSRQTPLSVAGGSSPENRQIRELLQARGARMAP